MGATRRPAVTAVTAGLSRRGAVGVASARRSGQLVAGPGPPVVTACRREICRRVGIELLRAPLRAEEVGSSVEVARRGGTSGVDVHAADGVDHGIGRVSHRGLLGGKGVANNMQRIRRARYERGS